MVVWWFCNSRPCRVKVAWEAVQPLLVPTCAKAIGGCRNTWVPQRFFDASMAGNSRPHQKQIAQSEQSDPVLWARRRELMADLVESVMAGDMERAGVEWPGGRQPMDLPYSYIIQAPPDANGAESLHAHVITPAMDRDREQAFNVYRKDTQHTREVAERETERIFQLSRLRDREPNMDLQPGIDLTFPDREIEFHGR